VDKTERAEDQRGRLSLTERAAQSPFAGFAPWIIFWVVAGGPSTWEYGAIGAALAAIILAVPSARRGRVKMLDVVTIVFFIGFAIAGVVVGARDRDVIDTYSNTISSGVLGLMALGSLAFVPFTEQYARESTPPEVWHLPAFRRINRTLTLVWALAFLATAVLGYIAVWLPATSDWTNWVVPIVLMTAAVKFTRWYPEHARAARG
jgi:small-conductance mechanosensitive channel